MVIWTQPARADLKHIHDFIAEDSKHYARKVAQEIREKTDILDTLPEIGKTVPEIGKPDIRELHIYPIGLCMRSRTASAMCWLSSINGRILRQRTCLDKKSAWSGRNKEAQSCFNWGLPPY